MARVPPRSTPERITRSRAFAAVGRCGACVLLLAVAAVALPATAREDADAPPDDRAASLTEKEEALRGITERIGTLRREREKKLKEETGLTTSLEVLDSRIAEARLEMDRTHLVLDEVRFRIAENAEDLRRIGERLKRLRADLLQVVREVASYDRRSVLETILLEGTFSDFLQRQEAAAAIQRRMTTVVRATEDARQAREQRAHMLEEREEEFLRLQQLQEAQKASLAEEEDRKRSLLAANVAAQAVVGARIAEAEAARREIQREIFTLRNAGIHLSLREAEDLARYAGDLTGVRPSLLLGVLKVESNIGASVGSGRYPDDVHPAHRDAFLRVAKNLGLDPHETPVSAKPTTYAGWGGAMGPGQIMPGTWERIEGVVGRLMGEAVPTPFELRDAFVATAVILQGSGAADGREVEAVNRYFAGPNWQRFTWYGDRVMAVAKEYEARGL